MATSPSITGMVTPESSPDEKRDKKEVLQAPRPELDSKRMTVQMTLCSVCKKDCHGHGSYSSFGALQKAFCSKECKDHDTSKFLNGRSGVSKLCDECLKPFPVAIPHGLTASQHKPHIDSIRYCGRECIRSVVAKCAVFELDGLVDVCDTCGGTAQGWTEGHKHGLFCSTNCMDAAGETPLKIKHNLSEAEKLEDSKHTRAWKMKRVHKKLQLSIGEVAALEIYRDARRSDNKLSVLANKAAEYAESKDVFNEAEMMLRRSADEFNKARLDTQKLFCDKCHKTLYKAPQPHAGVYGHNFCSDACRFQMPQPESVADRWIYNTLVDLRTPSPVKPARIAKVEVVGKHHLPLEDRQKFKRRKIA